MTRQKWCIVQQNMYSSFLASEIQELELNDGTTCKYYTATYMLAGETLTDYIAEFSKNNVSILAKLGTIFYPINTTDLEACELLYNHLN